MFGWLDGGIFVYRQIHRATLITILLISKNSLAVILQNSPFSQKKSRGRICRRNYSERPTLSKSIDTTLIDTVKFTCHRRNNGIRFGALVARTNNRYPNSGCIGPAFGIHNIVLFYRLCIHRNDEEAWCPINSNSWIAPTVPNALRRQRSFVDTVASHRRLHQRRRRHSRGPYLGN